MSLDVSTVSGQYSEVSPYQKAISINRRGSSPNRKKRSSKSHDDADAQSTHSRKKEVQAHATNSKTNAVQIRTLHDEIDAMVDIIGVSTLYSQRSTM